MRLFYAIDVDDKEIINKIKNIIKELKPFLNCKWVESYNYHITIKFLGEVSPSKLNYLKNILDNIKIQPFEIKLKSLGYFGNPPRVLWIGVESNTLHKLFEYINQNTLNIRKEDKQFTPHLTLGRIKFVLNFKEFYEIIEKYSNYDFGTVFINKIHLKKSILTPNGPIYENIYTKIL